MQRRRGKGGQGGGAVGGLEGLQGGGGGEGRCGELREGPSHGVTPPPTATKRGQGVEVKGMEVRSLGRGGVAGGWGRRGE